MKDYDTLTNLRVARIFVVLARNRILPKTFYMLMELLGE